jgi:hypothetical protein
MTDGAIPAHKFKSAFWKHVRLIRQSLTALGYWQPLSLKSELLCLGVAFVIFTGAVHDRNVLEAPR